MKLRRTFLVWLVMVLLLGGILVVGIRGAQAAPLGPERPLQDGFDTQLLLYIALGLAVVGFVVCAVLVFIRRRRQAGAAAPRLPKSRARAAVPEEAPPEEEVAVAPPPAEPAPEPVVAAWPTDDRAAPPREPAVAAWPTEDRAPPPPEEEAPPAPPPAAPPPQVDQLVQQGVAQVKGGDVAGGYATLRGVVEQAPDNAEAWLWLGMAAARQNNITIAERCFERAQQLGHPKAGQAMQWLKGQQG